MTESHLLMSVAEETVFEFAEFSFDTSVNTLSRRGLIVALEPVSARVLRYLLENQHRLVPKEELLEAVWPDVFTTDDVLKRAVSQIRRALGDDARNSRFLETHHRRGYRFIVTPAVVKRDHFQPVAETALRPTEYNSSPRLDCFIGRSRELEFLKSEFINNTNGSGQPVMIFGEPGIGKTQTAAKFTEWAEKTGGALPLRIRFFDYEASFVPAFDVFLDLLKRALLTVTGKEIDDLRAATAAELGVELPSELFTNNPSEGRIAADNLRAVVPIAESFVSLSRHRPLILVFDDIQWADRTSRQIIGHLMRVSSGTPLMILGLTRHGELEDPQSELAQWLQMHAVYRSFTMLELVAMSVEDYRELISEVFGGRLNTSQIPSAELARLHSATGGNPYFLVETLRLLINAGVINKTADESWRWDGLRDIPLPETVRMAARAKLGVISTATREVVEYASVLGDSFLIDTLALMLGEDGNTATDAVEKALEEAVAAQILTEHRVGGANDCQFYHTTIRRAVYLDLSPRRRKRLHTRAMRAIEASHADDSERFSAALASHAENAGDFVRSLDLNLRAARAAAARFDWLEAAELTERAERVGRLGRIPETVEYLAVRGEVLMSIGRRSEAELILSRAAEMQESAEVLHNLGRTRILLGRYHDAVTPLESAIRISREKNDPAGESAALIQFASAKYALCEYEESCAILQKIIDANRPESYLRAVALGKLGWTRALQSRYDEAREHLLEALSFHQSAGDMRERAVLAMCLNWCEHGSGQYEAAIRYAQQARREAELVGEPYNESVALMRIAKARIAQGFSEEVIDDLSQLATRQEKLNARHALAETIWIRGRARREVGEFAAAKEDFERSLDSIREIGDRDDEFRILIDVAHLQRLTGDFGESLETARQALAIADDIGVSEGVGAALIAVSLASHRMGDAKAAASAARESAERLDEVGSGELWHALMALADALANDESAAAELETVLRRAVAELESMRGQFQTADKARFTRFTNNRNYIARRLCEVLRHRGKSAESAELARSWLID